MVWGNAQVCRQPRQLEFGSFREPAKLLFGGVVRPLCSELLASAGNPGVGTPRLLGFAVPRCPETMQSNLCTVLSHRHLKCFMLSRGDLVHR